jgi:hypothetical protein
VFEVTVSGSARSSLAVTLSIPSIRFYSKLTGKKMRRLGLKPAACPLGCGHVQNILELGKSARY